MNFPSSWQLPAAIASRVGESGGRQRAMSAEGHLLLILHQVPDAESPDRVAVLFWRSAEGEWHTGDGRRGVAHLREHLQSYDRVLDEMETHYERAQTAQEYFRILEMIVPIHRAASNQHATLQSAREALPEAREIISLRDIAGDVERAAELLHTDAKNALDFRVAQQAEQQAQSSHEMAQAGHRLNLLAALFLPASVIMGAFGTSLQSGLESGPPWLFWVLLAGSFVVGGAIWLGLNASAKK